MSWWSQIPYHISPYLFQINGVGIRYYSLMYVLAFVTVYLLIKYRLRTEHFNLTMNHMDDFIIWAAIGVLLGGRLGYVLFYDFGYYRSHLLNIFSPFDFYHGFTFTGISGMSYHGGLLGVAAAVYFFCRKNRINLWEFSDLLCPAAPLGYTFGRLGNFFNSELFGKVTTLPWGMYFPTDPAHSLRHPSQLYEAFFEGIVLFVILWMLRRKKRFIHLMFSLYLIGYGSIRFIIEFFRKPDDHLNYVFYIFTMGQVLCFLMILTGLFLMMKIKGKPDTVNTER
ncbi:MAG: prolipoprotein diacylglyceryl transferase [Proteobacteria bacterium]|nr:prolipoprotein diacylglyceryl transferase [Pseudomonadota bacterium]MBU1584768.1 prolipoprotein diacylglyceryl transferase [Pseudomonadota bacterium]MBU2455218.1 prolipoprotein diacylglyceryl transferase [Pseudomonadota bacterium]MBU2631563.1 prolipoprotein diacylglyceryl transferase [Pseudomonadota bacterium]